MPDRFKYLFLLILFIINILIFRLWFGFDPFLNMSRIKVQRKSLGRRTTRSVWNDEIRFRFILV